MRKAIVIALALGLIAGSVAAPATAKKKKKKAPVATPVTFWFHNDSDPVVCTDDAVFTLMLTEAKTGGNCGNRVYGAGYAAAEAAGIADPYTYNAIEGLPFVLDATQKITATIYVSSTRGEATNPVTLGIGQTTLVATLQGTTAEGAKELGSQEVTYTVLPGEEFSEVKLEFEPDAALDKAEFTGLGISLHNQGNSINHGYYRTNNPASFIVIPTWK